MKFHAGDYVRLKIEPGNPHGFEGYIEKIEMAPRHMLAFSNNNDPRKLIQMAFVHRADGVIWYLEVEELELLEAAQMPLVLWRGKQ